MRHPTPEERQTLKTLVESCGAPEVLRVIAQLVGTDSRLATSDLHRAQLNKVARDIDSYLKAFK